MAANGTVIGVSPDSVKALANFRAKLNLPYVLLSDPDHKVAGLYGVWQQKKMYGRAYFGIVRSHYVMDEASKIADVQIGVSPAESVSRAAAFVTGS